jgi:VanZ family protein
LILIPSPKVSDGARKLFVALLAIVLILTLTPSPPRLTGLLNDKVEHAAAFLLLALTGLLGWPRRPAVVLVFLLGVGAGIELLQGTSLIERDVSVFDWFADIVGLVAGTAFAYSVAAKLDRVRRRGATRRVR